MSSSFVSEARPRGFLHAPPCGLAPSHPGFPARDYLGQMLETTWVIFDQGGISPYLIIWRGACPGWLSPPNDDPGSTQILTQHCGVKSQAVSQLVNLGTVPTSKSPLFSPFESSEHLGTGPACMPCHILTTRIGLWGFIKSSAQTYRVHMELCLHLNFQLMHSLRGYTVHTTTGF
jgi:hypothetical protein